MSLDLEAADQPEVLTVEEAAAVLRIGRSAAYALARRYRATGGREGLPVIELGRNLRVPRVGLVRLLNGDGGNGDSAGSTNPLSETRAS